MLQDEENIFQLSPLNWERNTNQTADSKESIAIYIPTSPILSSRLSKASSTSSVNSFNYRRNAGSTPKKTLEIKNSLDALRHEHKHKFQVKSKENTITNSLIQNSKESAVFLNEKKKDIMSPVSTPLSEGIHKQSLISLWPTDATTGSSKSSPIPISKFDLTPRRNSNRLDLTLDDLYDSDIDMFEEFTSQKKYPSTMSEETIQSIDLFHMNLANYSCQYAKDKSKFMLQFGFDETNYLEKELFQISRRKIQEKINRILEFLEDLNE